MAFEKPYNPWYYYIGDTLVKKRKPIKPGDEVHIHKWEGCYKVYAANTYGFVVMKKREKVTLPWEEFRCHKGGGESPETQLKHIRRQLLSLAGFIETNRKR